MPRVGVSLPSPQGSWLKTGTKGGSFVKLISIKITVKINIKILIKNKLNVTLSLVARLIKFFINIYSV